MKKTPRYYQVDFRAACFKAWEKHRKIVGVLPTSGGKTICAAMLFEAIVAAGGRPLFCGDTDELCDQPLEKIRDFAGMYPGLEKADIRAPLSAECVVGSLQTMSRENRFARFPRDHFTHIIFDEAHRNVQLHEKVCAHFSAAKVLGITATDFRLKMKDLSAYYECVAFRMETFDMVDAGFIPPIKVMTLPIDIDISQVKQTRSIEGNDYDKTEMAEAIRPFFVAIADSLRENLAGKQIVAFLPLVNSSKDFASICRERGVSARHVDGDSPDRAEILAAYERKQFQLITCSQLLTTGWDCPPAEALLNLRQTRSVGLFRQMAGRVIRVLPGVIDHIPEKWQAELRKAAIAESEKSHALIIDLLWQTEKFGLAGPASLIASTPEEADALGKKMRQCRLPMDIQGVSKEYQEEQEQKLIDMLRRAARRHLKVYDARAIGKLLGDQQVMDFKAKFFHEMADIPANLKAALKRENIDIKTVQNAGHAAYILRTIWSRRKRKEVSIEELIADLDKTPMLPIATPPAEIVKPKDFPPEYRLVTEASEPSQDDFLSWLTDRPGRYTGKSR